MSKSFPAGISSFPMRPSRPTSSKAPDELAAQTKLDPTIFATRIAPALNITVRFVGEEPTDKTTLAYNQAMREVFAENGIELKVIPREQKGDQIVSASSVRRALAADDWETITSMVPKTTLTYLRSEDGADSDPEYQDARKHSNRWKEKPNNEKRLSYAWDGLAFSYSW